MHVARSLAMLAVALGALLGLASTASAATTCAGSGYLITAAGKLQRFSIATNTVSSAQTLTGTGFADIAITPDGTSVYAVDRTGNAVFAINTSTTASTRIADTGFPLNAPVAIAISPDGARAYVVNQGSDKVSIIDTRANAVTGTIDVGALPTDVTVSVDGARLYVTDSTGLGAYPTGSGATTTWSIGSAAAVARTATTAYTANVGAANSVSAAPLADGGATTPYAGLGGQPQSIAVSPDGATLYIGTDASDQQSLLAVNLPSGGAPTPIGASGSTGVVGIAVSPDGATVYAAAANAVAVLTNGATTASALSGAAASGITAIAVCPAVVPGAPTGVTADPGDTLAAIGWTAPADTGGARITGYTVTASPGGATCTTTGTTGCTVVGLRNAIAYTFSVTAANVVGTGPASAASNRVTPRKDTRARALTIGPRTVRYTRRGIGVSFTITTDGAGVIAAALTFRDSRACQAARRVPAAGTYTIRCVLSSAARTVARRRGRTYALFATFSPTNGALASVRTTLGVPRRR